MDESSNIETPMVDGSAETTAAPTEPSISEAPAHVIYVGPRLVRPFPVSAMAVFRGPMPPPLAQAVADDPELAACFVPVAEAGTALRAVNRPGTALARAVAAVRTKYLTRKEG